MSRQVRQAQINTTDIDVWLEDPDITELRRAELLAARDRIAAIQTAMMINGIAKEDGDGGGDTWQSEWKARTKASETANGIRDK